MIESNMRPSSFMESTVYLSPSNDQRLIPMIFVIMQCRMKFISKSIY